MEDIIHAIENVLRKYGFSADDFDYDFIADEFNADDFDSEDFDEDPVSDIAEMVSIAIPWQFREGTERYNDLFDLMNLAIDLKYPTTKCVIGKEVVDETFRVVLLDGIRLRLKQELGKGSTKNYQYLYDYINKNVRQNNSENLKMSFWYDEKFQILFFLEDRVEAHLKRIDQTYESMPETDFAAIVENEFHYIEEHEEEIDNYPGSDSLRADEAFTDAGLLKNCLYILNEPIGTTIPIMTAKEYVRKIWAWFLGQGTVSNILSQYYGEIMPDIVFPLDVDGSDLSAYRIPTGKEAVKFLPFAMDTPQYRYVESLFAAYKEPFNNYWDNPECENALSAPSMTYEEMPLWNEEKRDINYLVAQYFYYCLAGLAFPKFRGKKMIKIGACIYDLLCLLQYREDDLDFSGETEKGIRKKKYDSVKRYLAIDPDTGYYKRLI